MLHLQGDMDAAKKVMVILQKHYLHKNSYIDYSIYVRQAVLDEDAKDYKGAIKSLNAVLSLPVKIMEAKTYLDLGRLYIKVGNREKAKSSLFYVVDNFAGEEFAKLAHLYLAQLKK
jgi:tetratricopeptide (TPR) repeat protein